MNLEQIEAIIAKNLTITDERLMDGVIGAVMDAVAADRKFKATYCSQCGQAFGPGDNGFSHCENHAGMFPTEPGTYLFKSKKPAEDLWSAILAAQVKMEEAK